MDWSDFTFSVGPGFADGNYTLIDAGTNASGGLSTGAGLLTGSIGGGTGVLSISGGQDLVLTVSGISPVVPEPASLALFAMGGLALVRRRR